MGWKTVTAGDEVEETHRKEWRQGSVLPPSLFAVAAGSLLHFAESESFPVVVSQDCDVVDPDYDDEPEVEIVRAKFIQQLDGGFTHAKSARRLHLNVLRDGAPTPVELSIRERRNMDRQALASVRPSLSLVFAPEERRLIAAWLAHRYRRPSYPDAFVERFTERKKAEKLRALLKKFASPVSGIYVLLRPDSEVEPEVNYEMSLWLTVKPEVFENETQYLQLQVAFFEPFKGILKSLAGITIKNAMLVSEKDFTVHDVANSKRLDFDYLTHRLGAEPPADP